MKQMINTLKNCEQQLNQQYDSLKPKNKNLEDLSIALKKIVKAIECLDKYNNKSKIIRRDNNEN